MRLIVCFILLTHFNFAFSEEAECITTYNMGRYSAAERACAREIEDDEAHYYVYGMAYMANRLGMNYLKAYTIYGMNDAPESHKKIVNKGIKYILKSAESNVPEAQYFYAGLYYSLHQPVDYIDHDSDAKLEQIKWLKKSAENGYEPAKDALITMGVGE